MAGPQDAGSLREQGVVQLVPAPVAVLGHVTCEADPVPFSMTGPLFHPEDSREEKTSLVKRSKWK